MSKDKRSENLNKERERRAQKEYDKEATRVDNANRRKALSPTEQLQRLDWRLGKNEGAKKERQRLLKQLANA